MTKDARHERTRDIVVVGCSAGGVEILPALLHQLPKDLAGSVTIVQHLAPSPNPYLVDILQRVSSLEVAWGEQGERVRHGRVYVAPPNVHMVFTNDHLRLLAGPRENHVRPSIDRLFRSAAAHHGSRVIAVVLTGMLDDGVAGLRAIHAAGGITIVQDPDEAPYPELPHHAIIGARPDYVMPVASIGQRLRELVGTPATPLAVPEDIALDARLDDLPAAPADQLATLGPQSTVTCPECGGATWLLGPENARRYRCYLGHVTSARTLLASADDQVEAALWSGVRALDERATTLETLAVDADKRGNAQSATDYRGRAREVRKQSGLARRFMHELVRPRP